MLIEKNPRLGRFAVFLLMALPIVLYLLSELFRHGDGPDYPRYSAFFAEDGPAENAQAAILFLSFLLSAYLARHLIKLRHVKTGSLYALASALFFFICMEELSWGQRIIGFASPEYFRARNSQSELNFHNLAGFQNSDYSDTWFYLGLKLGLLYCGIAWLLVPKRLASRFKSTIGFFVPSQVLCLYFLLPVLLYQCDPCRALGGPAIWQQNEIIEIPGYLGALLFFGLGVLRIRSTSPVKTEESMVAGESRD